jgi:hypothetical protein
MTMPQLVETQRDIHSPEIMATPSGCASTGAFGGSWSDERRLLNLRCISRSLSRNLPGRTAQKCDMLSVAEVQSRTDGSDRTGRTELTVQLRFWFLFGLGLSVPVHGSGFRKFLRTEFGPVRTELNIHILFKIFQLYRRFNLCRLTPYRQTFIENLEININATSRRLCPPPTLQP